jgi:hypothetical protein
MNEVIVDPAWMLANASICISLSELQVSSPSLDIRFFDLRIPSSSFKLAAVDYS